MFKPFQLKSRFNTGVVSTLLLLGSLTGCGVQDAAREIPKANAILQLLHTQDRSVIQIKLQQCQVGNLFAGQTGTSSKYDLYSCQVHVERFDDEYKQSFIQEQTIYLRPFDSDIGWQLIAPNE